MPNHPGEGEAGFAKRLTEINRQASELSVLRTSINPLAGALKIILIYTILGCLWIVFSDRLIGTIVVDTDQIQQIQLCKGWIFVLITAIIFFCILYRQINLYKAAVDQIYDGFREVYSSCEELMKMEQRLYSAVRQDELTKLPNRVKLMEESQKVLERAKESGAKFSFLYLDIDNFKHINDTMGQAAGDKLIRYIASILTSSIRSPNLVARLGGDEFAVLLVDVQSEEQVCHTVEFLHKRLTVPWALDGQIFYLSASIGGALYPLHGTDLDELTQNADTALSYVKDHGKNSFTFYNAGMRELALQYVRMNNQIQAALQNNEFSLHFQPQVELSSGCMIGAEALIRWKHPVQGFIPPDEFIPFAEKTGHIDRIWQWVLCNAFRQAAIWKERVKKEFQVSINMSGVNLLQEGLIETMKQTMQDFRIDGRWIILEVTETSVLTDLNKALHTLRGLKELGITIALDDFGTGYSSLTYLQMLPIDILKVDRGFVRDMLTNKESYYIFQLIVDLAHHLGMRVVAEGIETRDQLDFLISSRCDFGQGFYFGRPVPPDEFINSIF